MFIHAKLAASLYLSASCAFAAPACAPCSNNITLDTTNPTYTVKANDTIFTIAQAVNRGACDIARFNRIPIVELVYAGEDLDIPAAVCEPDNTSCLVANSSTNATCVLGGPVTYTTLPGDTVTLIAARFGITGASILGLAHQTNAASTLDGVIVTGNTVKIPVCENSSCELSAFDLGLETYVNVAKDHRSSVGQLLALNAQYNHSSWNGTGPTLALISNCTLDL